MDTLLNDIKYTIRRLLKKPIFTLTVVLTLAIGIGANTTMFSVVNSILLRPLPYPDSNRLVMVWESQPERGKFHELVSVPNYLEWQQQCKSFETMGLALGGEMNFAHGQKSCRIKVAGASSGLLSAFGVKPLFGRTFNIDDDQPGGNSVALLSHSLWQNQFGSDPKVIGQTIKVEGGLMQCTVIGVMPADFQPFNDNCKGVQCWLSLGTMEWAFQQRSNRMGSVVAKLKSGISLDQAQAEIESTAKHMTYQYPENKGYSAKIVPLMDETVKGIGASLWLLLAAVGLLLLIVCVNVANLLLTRLSSQEREMAVRTALGASPWRLIRQVFVESLILACLGGLIGVLMAFMGCRVLYLWMGEHIPRIHELSIDGRVLGFTAMICLVSCVLFGSVPALRIVGSEVLSVLRNSSNRSVTSRCRILQDSLVVMQISMALVLLISAGLLGRSFISLMHTELNMKPENVLTFNIGLPIGSYRENQKRSDFLSQLDAELQALPGVQNAGATSQLPFMNWNSVGFWVLEGLPLEPDLEAKARYQGISPDYFKTIGTPLVKGRFFDERDKQGTEGKIIINETMAQRFWPEQNPIGTRIGHGVQFGNGVPSAYEIVGIVADAKQQTLKGEIQPEMWWLNTQHPPYHVIYTIKTDCNPSSLMPSIRKALAQMDNTVTISDIYTLKERISGVMSHERFLLILNGLFSAASLLLASLGVYGVMAYAVSLRRQEIGIRIALGATRNTVLGLVLKKGVFLAGIGSIIGILGAWGVTRVMDSILYQINPLDPVTFSIVPTSLISITLLACYLPARRATKIDPMEALRYE